MRIEHSRSAGSPLEHAAAFHTGPTDLLNQVAPLANSSAGRGDPIAVALDRSTERALANWLGDAVALGVPGPDDDPSAQTTAARWALELRALTSRSDRPVTVLTEHQSRLDGSDGHFWTELHAALNVALADLPVRITCFYPELPLYQEVLDGARNNHPFLLSGGELHPNPHHRDPRDVLAERPVSAPPLLGPPDLRLPFSAWQLHEVRSVIEHALTGSGYEQERVEDVVLAVNEVATNAVEHGSPDAQMSLWADGAGLLCEIDDGGTLRDPLPGLRAPHPAQPRGRGVWIARQLCDSLHVWTDAAGTHVRMRAIP